MRHDSVYVRDVRVPLHACGRCEKRVGSLSAVVPVSLRHVSQILLLVYIGSGKKFGQNFGEKIGNNFEKNWNFF